MLQGRCWRLFSACAGRVAQSRGQPSQPSRRWCTSASHQENNHPVIIVGAGPSGLTLALWLSRYGVRSLILERASQLSSHPQAHYINNRTMEVLRPLQGLAAEVSEGTPPLDHWRTFRYCFSMTGALLGEVDHFKGQSSAHNAAVSPEPVAHLPQSRLLPMMMARASQPGSLVTLAWNTSVTSCEASREGVTVTVKDAQGKQKRFIGSFLAAADGAHSIVRQQLGIPMAGDAAMQHLINIHFTSPSLGARMLGNQSGKSHGRRAATGSSGGGSSAAMLYFVFNKDVVGVVVAHDLTKGEFVAQVPYFPPLQSPADFPEHTCCQLVAGAAGLDLTQLQDLKIHQVRPWTMSAVVADRFQNTPADKSVSSQAGAANGRGTFQGSQASSPASSTQTPQGPPRIFLLGDAAHRFPPAGGFGMNTGIQDAHNLAWKLALVLANPREPQGSSPREPLHGSAATKPLVCAKHLLSSYEAERRPVALANCALSVRNWHEAVGVPSQLGLDPRAATALDTAVRAVPLPGSAGKALLEAGLALGRAATTAWTPIRPWQLSRVKRVFDSGVTLRLQFPREDLGFCYSAPGSAVAASRATKAEWGTQVPSTPQRGSPYVPSSETGCRLPHVWLHDITPRMAHQQPSSHEQQSQEVDPGAMSQHARHGATEAVAHAGAIDADKRAASRAGSRQADQSGGGQAQSEVQWWSTLDVVAGVCHSQHSALTFSFPIQPMARPMLTLFTDDGDGKDNAWLRGASALQEHYHAAGQDSPLQVVQVLSQETSENASKACRMMHDVHGVWHATMQLPKGGVLLVRPDGHVAWRSTAIPAADVDVHATGLHASVTAGLLHAALVSVLGGM